METLPDYPCRPGGILIVGINPSPVSVAAGHYYQGVHGQRLWKRLATLGLLHDAAAGQEDSTFVAAGNGLTDLIKRPTSEAHMLTAQELRSGEAALRKKITEWKPGLILFAYRPPADILLGKTNVAPGRCPDLGGTRTFLLTSPYAPAHDTKRVNVELLACLGRTRERTGLPVSAQARQKRMRSGGTRLQGQSTNRGVVTTQRVTAADLASGRIRLPRAARSFFPKVRTAILVILRGQHLKARYDPRRGPDRERSAVLNFERSALVGIQKDTVLHVSIDSSGVPCID